MLQAKKGSTMKYFYTQQNEFAIWNKYYFHYRMCFFLGKSVWILINGKLKVATVRFVKYSCLYATTLVIFSLNVRIRNIL
jgi:hypothetical protein